MDPMYNEEIATRPVNVKPATDTGLLSVAKSSAGSTNNDDEVRPLQKLAQEEVDCVPNGSVHSGDDDDEKSAVKLYQGIDDDPSSSMQLDRRSTVGSVYSYTPHYGNDSRRNDRRVLDASSMASAEDETAMFEDILHPEMTEAVDTLEQLDFEENEIIQQLKKAIVSKKRIDRDFIQALCMELDFRRKEKVQTMETFRRVEEQRSENTHTLVKEMKRLRAQNREMMAMFDTKNRRQEGDAEDDKDVYDWVVDINLLGDLAKEGWKVEFSESFYRHMAEVGSLDQMITGVESDESTGDDVDESLNWQGAVIAVVGLYDKGKTFVLNEITQSRLPSGKKVTTKGLSFKHVNVENTNFVLLDSAGSYSPVKVVDDLSVAQKEATELFLLDLIFDLSDYFICVVNDFTSLDQRFLDKLTRGLQNSNKVFKEVIVIHNLKEVTSAQVLAHVWETQVTQIYSGGSRMSTQVAAVNPATNKLEERHVEWFKTRYSRHICLADHLSAVGRNVNPWTFSLLRYWLKSVFVPVDRKFSVVKSVIHHSNKKLSTYFKDVVRLTLQPGEEDRIKFIRPTTDGIQRKGQYRLPQVALDASGLMLTRPDSFIPPVDITLEDGKYTIYMDVPGLSAKDITLARQNVMTIIKGSRSCPYPHTQVIEKQERKYGDFTMTFNIPHNYERKWDSCHVENGVLCIKFKQDTDDFEQTLQHADDSGKGDHRRGSGSSSSSSSSSSSTRVRDPQFVYQPTGGSS